MIRAEGLGKKYAKARAGASMRTLRDAVADFWRPPPPEEEFWALRDASFEIAEGDFVGVLGRNGAGKTTLLRILSRITVPTTGWVELRGRVGSLLGAASGFHPELTGRENVYLSAAIMGVSRAEIRACFDRIVDFAGVAEFLDVPVKRYSSGMRSRLGFSISAFALPEILILDEVLAVGDVEFQEKALARAREISREGRTILYVSHHAAEIAELANKAMILDHGRLEFFGEAREGLTRYARMTHASPR